MQRILPVIFVISMLAGGMLTSCKKHLTEPPQDTTHKCDTCHTDTTHHPCDTCNKPCDTCNLNKDSLSHAFVWNEYINPTSDADNHFSGVWVFGQNDIYVVGSSLWHFDGSNFTLVDAIDNTYHKPMNGALSGNNIFAFSKTDFWMVHVSLAYHTSDGKYFDDLRFGAVNACWGTNSKDMFFVGNGGHIYHYNGTKFDTMISNTTKNLRSVWGTSHNNVWATGWNSAKGETVLMHYDGNNWTEDEFSSSGKINQYSIGTVWACDSSGHSIAVIAGTRVFHKTDNGTWRSDTSEVGNSLGSGNFVGIGAYGGSSTDLFAVGGWGFISHWNGMTWKKYGQFFDYSNGNYGADGFSMKDNTACVVGTKSGQKWMVVGTRK